MSVGHVAREVEAAGIPTVSVYVRAFHHVPEIMRLSRAVITPHPMGRPLGAPGDAERQSGVVRAALTLLETAERPGTFIELEEDWRPGRVPAPQS